VAAASGASEKSMRRMGKLAFSRKCAISLDCTDLRPQDMKFSELVRLLEKEDFRLVKEKGSIRYYGKAGLEKLIRIDYHGSKEVPTGTCQAILRAAGIKGRRDKDD